MESNPDLCGARLAYAECRLLHGHTGHHAAAVPSELADGGWADVYWMDGYQGTETWVTSIPPDRDMPNAELAWAIYGVAPTQAKADEWSRS